MERIVGCKYKLGRKIGGGSFGEIHLATHIDTYEIVVVKIETNQTKHPHLLYEARLYQILQGGSGIPSIKWSSVDGDNSIFVLDLMGQVSKICLCIVVTVFFSLQITRIECTHCKGFLHRDIKLDTFLMGLGRKANQLRRYDRSPSTSHSRSRSRIRRLSRSRSRSESRSRSPKKNRLLDIAKTVMKERMYVCNKEDGLINLSKDEKLKDITTSKSCSELYKVVGEDFWLSTYCNSTASQGYEMCGCVPCQCSGANGRTQDSLSDISSKRSVTHDGCLAPQTIVRDKT